jgi:bleomycin hydrolase
MIQHADLPFDDRLINHLSGDIISDGGQWDMVVNLMETYGIVPQSLYPESTHSSLSSPLNRLLKTKLREHAFILRDLSTSLRDALVGEDTIMATLRARKEQLVKEVYMVMTATLGVPPNSTEKFVWEYLDADGKAGHWEGTPRQFYNEFGTKPYSVCLSPV